MRTADDIFRECKGEIEITSNMDTGSPEGDKTVIRINGLDTPAECKVIISNPHSGDILYNGKPDGDGTIVLDRCIENTTEVTVKVTEDKNIHIVKTAIRGFHTPVFTTNDIKVKT